MTTLVDRDLRVVMMRFEHHYTLGNGFISLRVRCDGWHAPVAYVSTTDEVISSMDLITGLRENGRLHLIMKIITFIFPKGYRCCWPPSFRCDSWAYMLRCNKQQVADFAIPALFG